MFSVEMPGNRSVEEVMTKKVVTVSKDTLILDAAKIMDEKNIGCLVVVEDGVPIGIITEKDFLRKAVASQKDLNSRVEEIMSAPLISVERKVDYGEAAAIMTKNKIRRLPIIEEGKLYGIITMSDILPNYIDDLLKALDKISEMLLKLR
jgi:CBS domain-containing protein